MALPNNPTPAELVKEVKKIENDAVVYSEGGSVSFEPLPYYTKSETDALLYLDMLWENDRADSSDDFNAQTISVYNPKGYEGFLILFVQYSTSHQVNSHFATTGIAEGRLQDVGVDNTRGVRARVRGFSRVTNGNYEDFTFEDGKEAFGSSAPTTNNDAAKPWQIYGFHRYTEV